MSSTRWSCSTGVKVARTTSALPAFPTRLCSGFKTWNLTDLLILGGSVYGPDGPVEADVYINDGVITRVEAGGAAPDSAALIDARGMYVLPGAIDVHVHSRDPGYPDKEDFGTLTEAAAMGGVTTVLDMPNTVPGVDSAGGAGGAGGPPHPETGGG